MTLTNPLQYAVIHALTTLAERTFDLRPTCYDDVMRQRPALRSAYDGNPGIYVWISPSGESYVGRSANLYRRIVSYTHPSTLKRREQRVTAYLNRHGFAGVTLAVVAANRARSMDDLIDLEQAFMDAPRPSLNTEPRARPVRYAMRWGHSAASRRTRCRPVVVTDIAGTLLYVYGSRGEAHVGLALGYRSVLGALRHNRPVLGGLILRDHHGDDAPVAAAYVSHAEFQRCAAVARPCRAAAHPYARRVVVTDVRRGVTDDYPSIRAAARGLGVDRDSLRAHVRGERAGLIRGVYRVTYAAPSS